MLSPTLFGKAIPHMRTLMIYLYLTGVHLMGGCLMGVHLTGVISFTSLPCAQDPGGENPYIDTKDV
jgi:hypothetical protein